MQLLSLLIGVARVTGSQGSMEIRPKIPSTTPITQYSLHTKTPVDIVQSPRWRIARYGYSTSTVSTTRASSSLHSLLPGGNLGFRHGTCKPSIRACNRIPDLSECCNCRCPTTLFEPSPSNVPTLEGACSRCQPHSPWMEHTP